MITPDCLIAFSFGNRRVEHAVVPGPVNVALATYALERFPAVPKILQWEIDAAYHALPEVTEETFSIDRNTKRPGRYLDTRNVAEQAKHVMDENGWKTVVVVAHDDHLARAEACCRKLGMQVIERSTATTSIYDPYSHQFWTRGLVAFALHEVIANPLYRALRYR